MASSAHRILAKKFIGSVARLNQSVAVSVATETTKWNRSEEFADKIGKDIVNLIEKKPKNVPEGVTELCVRESKHPSESDPVTHWTCLCKYENGTEVTRHIYT